MKAQTDQPEIKTSTSLKLNGQTGEGTGQGQEGQPGHSGAAEFSAPALPEETLPAPPGDPAGTIREQAPPEAGTPPAFADLRTFYVTAARPAGAGGEGAALFQENLIPAVLYSYRNLSRVRYDYPLCLPDFAVQAGLPDSSGEEWTTPLRTIFDRLAEKTVPEGEEGESFRQNLLRLEERIKRFLENEGTGRLADLWEAAANQILEEARSQKQKDDVIAKQFAAARNALTGDGILLPCDSSTPERLLQAAAVRVWRKKIEKILRETDDLIARLRDTLDTDEARASRAYSAEGLKASIGKGGEEEVDFSAMSTILARSQPAQSLPEKRQRRIEESLRTLESLRPFLAGESGAAKSKNRLAHPGHLTDSAKTALESARRGQKTFVAFFKALRIARLEVKNRYQEEKHDAFFETFDLSLLTPEEIGIFPPVLVSLTANHIKAEDKSLLLDLLGSDFPVKILLRVDDLGESPLADDHQPPVNFWAAQLAGMALNLNHSYVLQTGLSNPAALAGGLLKGLEYQGPALFAVYTAAGAKDHSPLPAYLLSAAAARARAFPGFAYDPGRGTDWASRFSVSLSTQSSRAWPEMNFPCQTAEGQEKTAAVEFTYADFLAADRRFAGQFLPLPPAAGSEKMVLLGEYFRLSKEDMAEKVPFLWMVDEKGILWRVVVGWRVVAAAQKIAARWQNLQELAGINNSHLRRMAETEQKRLQDETRPATETVAAQAAPSRNMDELSRDIAFRIINGLIAVGRGEEIPSAPLAVPSLPPSPAPAAPVAVAPAEKAQEVLIIEEAYIDSPLCTSCNDCININNRMFAYNENKQAYIKDAGAGTFKQLVQAAEKCPVQIIHPGKPKNSSEPGLEALIKRAAKFNRV
ncbi:MAG: ferredoxin [Calditrichaceae bacterium]|nr:ferredoxin [Calditrichia bacterium]NUQ41835.1 ferredoxin [Calditrichaceae bacterium]